VFTGIAIARMQQRQLCITRCNELARQQEITGNNQNGVAKAKPGFAATTSLLSWRRRLPRFPRGIRTSPGMTELASRSPSRTSEAPS
jgi:hypothetical protein